MFISLAGKQVHGATGAVSFEGRSDPIVVLIHGAGMDRTVWSQQTRFLAHHGFRALAIDLPDHGKSEGPVLESIPALSDWIAKISDYFGEKIHLVGHSMGALTALHAAGHHQDSVSSVSLLGVGASMPVHPELQEAADANDVKAAQLITSWGHGTKHHLGNNPTPGLSMTGGTQALIESTNRGILSVDLAACASYEEAVVAAENIECRTLFLLGSEDKMTPRKSAQPLIDAVSAEKEVVDFSSTGHMVMIEEPDLVRQKLLAHMTSS